MPAAAKSADVSVIMPAYRAERTIRRALMSVLEQTVQPSEIVIVDDGSDDGTLAAAREISERSKSIRFDIRSQANRGAGSARNVAIAASTGAFMAFLDADDEWLPTKLERSLDVLGQTGADIVSHDFIAVGVDGEHYVDCSRHFRAADDVFVGQMLRGFIANTTVLVRREMVLGAGGFDPSLRSGQDYELWLAVVQRPGCRLHVFPEALTRYHVTPGSITSNVDERRRCALRILNTYAPSLRRRKRAALLLVLLRSLIVHVQAATAHWRAGRPGSAAKTMLLAAPNVLQSLAASAMPQYSRPDFLAQI